MAKELTKEQGVFVNEYLKHGNQTKAYVTAFGDSKGAAQSASRLMKSAKIQSALAQIRQSVIAKVDERKAVNNNLAAATDTAQAIAITAENMMFNLARMGLTEHLRSKFLCETEGHLRYDFSTATEEELAAISAQVDGVKFKCTTRIEPRKDQEPVEIRTIESSITWVDRKSVIDLMGRYREIMAWKDVVEVKDPGAMTAEERQAEIKKILNQALARGGKQLVEGTIN